MSSLGGRTDKRTNGPTEEPFSRRDFLRLSGFSLAAGVLWNGCARTPVHEAIPYLVAPEDMVPGQTVWQTAVCGACPAGCGMLVKIRDGRPIKLEGNPDHPLSRGGLCPIGQASLLGLYDERRLRAPLAHGEETDWGSLDAAVSSGLAATAKSGGVIRVLTGTITSPTTADLLSHFAAAYPGSRCVTYDPVSSSAIPDAYLLTHGVRVLPRFRFDRAEVIVGFEADFLGTWFSPVEFTAGYAAGRSPDRTDLPAMSYHAQFESTLTITGAKADDRFPLKPSEVLQTLARLAAEIAAKAGVRLHATLPPTCPIAPRVISDLTDRLWQHRGTSLVVCGLQNTAAQSLCSFINEMLQNHGTTVDLAVPSYQRQGNDLQLHQLLDEINAGQVDALIIAGVNPVYDLPDGRRFAEGVKRIPLVVAVTDRQDETSALAQYVCAQSNPLESWWDVEPAAGLVAVSQPSVDSFGATRTFAEVLAAWLGTPASAYDLLRGHWQKAVSPRSQAGTTFSAFWAGALEKGFQPVTPMSVAPGPFNHDVVEFPGSTPADAAAFELTMHPGAAMQDGRHAYNPYLHELPDPITKVTWDNVATLSPASARRLGVETGDVIRIEVEGTSVELPAFVFPGLADGVVGLALGFGRQESSRFKDIGPQWLFGRTSVGDDGLVGRNVAPLVRWADGCRQYHGRGVTATRTGSRRALACTQEHGDLRERNRLLPEGAHSPAVINETVLAAYQRDRHSATPQRSHAGDDLWPEDHPNPNHRWAMAIDLNKCTGCSACIVSCNMENNIPVVGRDEVRRNRELHWLRIDRYYSEEDGRLNVAFLPMLCQQCGHAPCETVCPVLATVHSEEGLNQQAYNRCVGTRYCANNCPYKVRRFNWFDYPFAHGGRERMLLNPDVTVRSRGVMEKCTFCVQRIQEAKAEAKAERRALHDGEVQPACQQSCPADAIVFGDLKDPQSEVSRMMLNPRRYGVLEELNVRPAVGYLAVVRNRESAGSGSEPGEADTTIGMQHG